MKEFSTNYHFFLEEDHRKVILQWEKHPHNGKEMTIIGETEEKEYRGEMLPSRWIVEYDGRITDLSKKWF